MVAEAATVEAVWVVEPPLLEHLLDQEVSAYCSETVSFQLPLRCVSRRGVCPGDANERHGHTTTTPAINTPQARNIPNPPPPQIDSLQVRTLISKPR